MKTARLLLGTAVFVAGCHSEGTNPAPDLVASTAVAPSQTAAAPMAPPEATMSAAPAPSASAEAPDAPKEAYCVTAAESMEIAKPHQNADAPYSTCAAGISNHCGGGNGERGHLCSKPLNVKATALSRKTKPGTCCYGGD